MTTLLIKSALQIADQAVLCDIECEGRQIGAPSERRWDVSSMFDANEHSAQVIDMAEEGIAYAVSRGLVEIESRRRFTVRILRDDAELWSQPFLTGEENMSYNIADLEHHHFKYEMFRQPGDVHCHYFGTATLSFSAGIVVQDGDLFEIEAPGFGKPLRNPVVRAGGSDALVTVRTL